MHESVEDESVAEVSEDLSAIGLPMQLVTVRRRCRVNGARQVANIGFSYASTSEDPAGAMPPRTATAVADTTLTGEWLLLTESLDSLLAPEAGRDCTARFRDRGWTDGLPADAEQHAPDDGRAKVLLRSPTLDLGVVVARCSDVPETGATSDRLCRFEVRLTAWLASAGTDCGVHREHSFLEHHIQLAGLGCMQKFHDRGLSSLYETQHLAEGSAQPGLHCRWPVDDPVDPGTFAPPTYPWHQYRARTDCVFAVVEYHPEPVEPADAR